MGLTLLLLSPPHRLLASTPYGNEYIWFLDASKFYIQSVSDVHILDYIFDDRFSYSTGSVKHSRHYTPSDHFSHSNELRLQPLEPGKQ